jgi:hypothetical protein
MIHTAEEFIRLCLSKDANDCQTSLSSEASLQVWNDVIENYPSNMIDVAQNRTIPDEIMIKLVDRGDKYVRDILAQKRRLTPSLFSVLASDSNEMVRGTIAANAKTPLEIVEQLMSDPVEEVKRIAKYSFQSRSIKKPK